MNKLAIIGASGHGKVVADIAEKVGYTDIVFVDDDETIKECAGLPVIGTTILMPQLSETYDFFVAIGNAKIRQRILKNIANFGNVATLVHPHASISRRVSIGTGSVIMAGAVINSDVTIGAGCIVNTSASIDHDCIIDDYAHVSVGAHIAGTVHLGARTWVGIGAAISNNINVCDDCMIGAGAAVIENIIVSGTYVGVPARKAKAS